jgi:hypothetical protein
MKSTVRAWCGAFRSLAVLPDVDRSEVGMYEIEGGLEGRLAEDISSELRDWVLVVCLICRLYAKWLILVYIPSVRMALLTQLPYAASLQLSPSRSCILSVPPDEHNRANGPTTTVRVLESLADGSACPTPRWSTSRPMWPGTRQGSGGGTADRGTVLSGTKVLSPDPKGLEGF